MSTADTRALAYSRLSTLGDWWGQYALLLGRFPHLSPANIALIAEQRPDATLVRTRTGWATCARRPIQSGFTILSPRMRGSRPVRALSVRVWDVQQTIGQECDLPAPREAFAPPGFFADLASALAHLGFTVTREADELNTVTRLSYELCVAYGASEDAAHLARYALCSANGILMPVPDVPGDPLGTVKGARRVLRQILRTTVFRNMCR